MVEALVDGFLGVDQRVTFRGHYLGAVRSGGEEQLPPPLGAGLHVRPVLGQGADAGDAYEAEELVHETALVLVNVLFNVDDVFHNIIRY